MQQSHPTSTPVLTRIKNTLPTPENILDTSGSIITFTAMIPQGIFGSLLIDSEINDLLDKLNAPMGAKIPVRALVSFVIFATAVAGKYGIVRSYNTQTFKNLAHPQWWKENFNLTQWEAKHFAQAFLKIPLTVIASGVFAYLSVLSLSNAKELVDELGLPEVSPYLTQPYIEIPFEVCAFICNVLGFPFIVQGGIDAIANRFETRQYKNMKRELLAYVNTSRKNLKTAFLNKNHSQLDTIFHKIFGHNNIAFNQLTFNDYQTFLTTLNALNADALLDNTLQFSATSSEAGELVAQSSHWAQYIIKHASASLLFAISVWGLLNFYNISADAAAYYRLDAINIGNWLGIADMTAMGMLAYSVYDALIYFLELVFFNQNYDIEILRNITRYFLNTLNFLTCAIGGTPNIYQGNLVGEPAWVMPQEAIASMAIEMPGLDNVIKNSVHKKVITKMVAEIQKYEQQYPPVREVNDEHDSIENHSEENEEDRNDGKVNDKPAVQEESQSDETTPLKKAVPNAKKQQRYQNNLTTLLCFSADKALRQTYANLKNSPAEKVIQAYQQIQQEEEISASPTHYTHTLLSIFCCKKSPRGNVIIDEENNPAGDKESSTPRSKPMTPTASANNKT